MSDDLFTSEAMSMDSPRLAWMKRHGIVTYHSCPGDEWSAWYAGFRDWWPEPEYADAASFFCAETGHNGDSRVGEGDTEDEAIAHLARRNGLKLWNEEGAQ